MITSTAAMDAVDRLSNVLTVFYIIYSVNRLQPSHQFVQSMVRRLAQMIDIVLQPEPTYDQEVAEAVEDNIFFYNLAPPQPVVRELDVNSRHIGRRRYRRYIRRAKGKENRRPR